VKKLYHSYQKKIFQKVYCFGEDEPSTSTTPNQTSPHTTLIPPNNTQSSNTVPTQQKQPQSVPQQSIQQPNTVNFPEETIKQLMGLGFPREEVINALRLYHGNAEAAAGHLFGSF